MNRHAFLTVAAAGAIAFAVAGCAGMSSTMRYGGTLAGAQEVPPKNVPGTGTADVEYNKQTGMLKWTVTYSGLTGPLSAGHIHGPAAAGANAGVLVPFAAGPSPLTGEKAITPQQAEDLAAGKWYVNLHTPQNPGGEIRAQLLAR